MSLPYLQSYNDPKIEKAYRLYLDGGTQRKILGKVKGLSQRTLARYCKNDGWEAERKARSVTEEAPNVAAVAAEVAAPAAKPAETESRTVRMERMLERQQRIAGRLLSALERDIEQTFAAAEAAGKNPTRAQIAQLTSLSNNLLSMERKAWGVPDKIETKDTTPQKPDPVREMTDEQLERELEAARRERAAAAEREAAPGSVN